jgi:signal transduction histidine kinase
MSVAGDLRRLCVGGRAYWLRVLAVTAVTVVVLTALFAGAGLAGSLAGTLRDVVVHSAVMAALAAFGVPWLWRRLAPYGAATKWAVMFPFVIGLAAVGTLLACGLVAALVGSGGAGRQACFPRALPINAVITLTVCTGMTLYESQRRRLHEATLELRTRELDRERDRKMALQARLASLESRLQPHFLFNTLNAISALIQDDPDQAERTVERLAALLRFSLDAAERGLVPLAHELKIVTDYLEIEHTRLGDRLRWDVDVSTEVVACEVPPLALQTLVENSVKHAIAPRPSGGRVRVSGGRAGDRLTLVVWDDGPGFGEDAVAPGHGLDSVRQRLGARFGDRAALAIGRRDGGTAVTLTLPAASP